MNKHNFRTIPNEALTAVIGAEDSTGGRHAERSAADTSVSASHCDVLTIPIPFTGVGIQFSGCGDGSGGVHVVPL